MIKMVGLAFSLCWCHAEAEQALRRQKKDRRVLFRTPYCTVNLGKKNKVLPGLEPGLSESESEVITATLQNLSTFR